MIDCTLGPQLLSDDLIELGSSHRRSRTYTLECVYSSREILKKKEKKSNSYFKLLTVCLWFILWAVCVWSQQSLYAQHCFRSGFGSFPSSPRRGRLSPWAKIMRKPPLYRFAVGNAASLGPNARISSSVGSSAGGGSRGARARALLQGGKPQRKC